MIKRNRPGSARARDFFDIYLLTTQVSLTLPTEQTQSTLVGMFESKRVPLVLLDQINDFRDFHRVDFAAVQATVAPGTKVEDFDFYFDYVVELVAKLKPLWNK